MNASVAWGIVMGAILLILAEAQPESFTWNDAQVSLPVSLHLSCPQVFNTSVLLVGGCINLNCSVMSSDIFELKPGQVPSFSPTGAPFAAVTPETATPVNPGWVVSRRLTLTRGGIAGPHSAVVDSRHVSEHPIVYIVRSCTIRPFNAVQGRRELLEDANRRRFVTAVNLASGVVNESFAVIPLEWVRYNASCIAHQHNIYIVGGINVQTEVHPLTVDVIHLDLSTDDRGFYEPNVVVIPDSIQQKIRRANDNILRSRGDEGNVDSFYFSSNVGVGKSSNALFFTFASSESSGYNKVNVDLIATYSFPTEFVSQVLYDNISFSSLPGSRPFAHPTLFGSQLFITGGMMNEVVYCLFRNGSSGIAQPQSWSAQGSVVDSGAAIDGLPLVDMVQGSMVLKMFSFGGISTGHVAVVVQSMAFSAFHLPFVESLSFVDQSGLRRVVTQDTFAGLTIPPGADLTLRMSALPSEGMGVRLSPFSDCSGPFGTLPYFTPWAAGQYVNISLPPGLVSRQLFVCVTDGVAVPVEQGEVVMFFSPANILSPFQVDTIVPPPPVPSNAVNFSTPMWIAIFVLSSVVLVMAVSVNVYFHRNGFCCYEVKPSSIAARRDEIARSHIGNSQKYTVLRKLGSGGNGEVFLVKRKRDGELFAIKHVRCHAGKTREELFHESDLLERLKGHPHLIPIIEMSMHEQYDEDDEPFDIAEGSGAFRTGTLNATHGLFDSEHVYEASSDPRQATVPKRGNLKISQNSNPSPPGRELDTGDRSGSYDEARTSGLAHEQHALLAAPLTHRGSGLQRSSHQSSSTHDIFVQNHEKLRLVRYQCITMPYMRRGDLASFVLERRQRHEARHAGSKKWLSKDDATSLSETSSSLARAQLGPSSIPSTSERRGSLGGASGLNVQSGSFATASVINPQNAGLLSESAVLSIAFQVLTLLKFLHTRKPFAIAHCDLKPENILVADVVPAPYVSSAGSNNGQYGTAHSMLDAATPTTRAAKATNRSSSMLVTSQTLSGSNHRRADGTLLHTPEMTDTFLPVVVSDLGQAMEIPTDYDERSKIRLLQFTLPYVAPECASSNLHRVSTKVDIWALGCVLYSITTASLSNADTVIMFEEARKPDFASTIQMEICDFGYSTPLANLIVKMLEVDPERRPSAAELLQMLVWQPGSMIVEPNRAVLMSVDIE